MRSLLLALAFVLFTAAPAFAQDAPPTIAAIVAADERLTTLGALLETSEVMSALLDNPDGAFTLFAPVDGAWAYERPETSERLDLLPLLDDPARGESLLRYYTLPTAIKFETTSSFMWDYGTMLPGYTILSTLEEALLFNNVPVSKTIPASNGVVAIVDEALPILTVRTGLGREMVGFLDAIPAEIALPAAEDSVIDVLTAAGEFSVLLRLLATYPETAARLDNGGLYTLIAPTDAAWEIGGYMDGLLDQFIAESESQMGRRLLDSQIIVGSFSIEALRRVRHGRGIHAATGEPERFSRLLHAVRPNEQHHRRRDPRGRLRSPRGAAAGAKYDHPHPGRAFAAGLRSQPTLSKPIMSKSVTGS
jgi:uncharacterized surface protein with fasciclin (FAS1) repeats